jgi:hypothetical protein
MGGDGAGDEFQGPSFGVEVEVASEADQLPVIFRLGRPAVG